MDKDKNKIKENNIKNKMNALLEYNMISNRLIITNIMNYLNVHARWYL